MTAAKEGGFAINASAPSWWKLFQEKREKKEARGRQGRERLGLLQNPFLLLLRSCGKQKSEKKLCLYTMTFSPWKAPSLEYSPHIDTHPSDQFKEGLVGVEETGFTHSSGIQ